MAEGRWGQAIGGPETIEKAGAGCVERHLVAKVTENCEVGPLDIDAALILDQAPRSQVGRTLVAEVTMKQEPGLRQGGLGAGEDLGKADGAGSEEHGVAAVD